MTQTKKIFLASSAELKGDRDQFEIFIGRKNKDWVDQGVFIELIVWEDFLDAVSKTGLQNEYNNAIRECDIFVMLFCTKVGQYTEEE
ncbi:MAG: GUN4 domain-containing protein, partial [Gammaproteobacteria bacterium]